MAITNLKSIDEFDKYIKSPSLLAIHFYASWADQCKQINDVFDMLAGSNDYINVRFATIEAEEIPELSMRYKIAAVPTVILIKDSAEIDRVDGVNVALLVEKIIKHMVKINSMPSAVKKSDISLEERLKKLINQAPCMLFMKGDPELPRCGFSKTIVSLLDSHNVDYQSFDILQDNVVREGLKKYSNWPTYPQLYLNGELLGGLDIIKEMDENGELNLPKKSSVETKS